MFFSENPIEQGGRCRNDTLVDDILYKMIIWSFISIFDVAFTDGKIVLLLLGVWSRALQIGEKSFDSFLHFGK